MPTAPPQLERNVTSPETRELPVQPAKKTERLQLSGTQVIASALAAVSATIAASYLGVAGTVIGAAIASVVTVVGNAVYGHSLRRTSARVKAAVPAAAYRWEHHRGADPSDPTISTAAVPDHAPDTQATTATPPVHGSGGRPWWLSRASLKKAAFACVALFATISIMITGIELATGKPLSDLLRGKSGSGTSFFPNSGGGRHSTPTTATPSTSAQYSPSTATSTSSSPSTVPTTPTATTTVTETTTASPSDSATPTSPAPTSSAASSSAAANGTAAPVP